MRSTLKIIKSTACKHLHMIAAGLSVIVILEMLSLYGPQLVREAVDILSTPGMKKEELLRIALFMCLLAIGVAVLRALGRPMLMAFGRIVEREIRDKFFSHVAILPEEVIDRNTTGELMSRSTYDINNIRLASGYGFQAGFSSLLVLIIALVYMLSMSPFLTVLSAIPMCYIPWLTKRQSNKFHDCHTKIQESFGKLTEESRDSLNAVRLIKVFNLTKKRSEHFEKVNREHFDNNMELVRVSAFYMPIMTLVTNMSQAIVWGLGGVLAVFGSITPGEIVAFSAYLVMLRTPLVYSGYLINLYQRARSSCERLDKVFDEKSEVHFKSGCRRTEESKNQSIIVKNLSYTYAGETSPVLKNINMEIPWGITSAIVGPVGSGKSTLLKLLTRIYEPPKGTIFFGHCDITKLSIPELRSHIAMADQNDFVFSESIRENLLLARPDAAETDLWFALENAGIADEVRSMPGMLDTVLGEKGHKVSGGQKGRLSLARTLLQKRPLMQLDDTLSSVDTRAEATIIKNIAENRNGYSNIIISHRPLSLSFCENIIVMNNGEIEDEGSHDELMLSSETYRSLLLDQKLHERMDA